MSLAGATVFSILLLKADSAPTAELNICRTIISKAREAEAHTYAADYFLLATMNYDEALKEWQVQNKEWYVRRDYSRMRDLIRQSTDYARKAETTALQTRGSLKDKVELDQREIRSEIVKFESRYYDLPLSSYLRGYYNKAKLFADEAREAYKRGDYPSAATQLTSGLKMIREANKQAGDLMSGYMHNVSTWQRWVDETIAISKRDRRSVIIVDKMAHLCRVYKNGRIKYEFNIEMGRNWLGDKKQRGDKATPEGRYYVTKKKNGSQTKYYKALLINYPNEQDKVDFEEAKRKGIISKNSNIGNLIEIHGDGGRGINWTDGCVALTNKDMDKLFDIVEVGTPVTIVGSLKNISEYNKN